MNAIGAALSKIYDVTNDLEREGVVFTGDDLKEIAKTLGEAHKLLKAAAVLKANEANKVQE